MSILLFINVMEEKLDWAKLQIIGNVETLTEAKK